MSMSFKDKQDYILKNRQYGSNFATRFFGIFGVQEAPSDKTLGVDTSHWNGFCNFVKMYSKGIKFGITKVSDVGWGTKKEFLDDKAIYNWKHMGEAQMLRGGYCWLDPNPYSTPESQAYFYLQEFYFKYPTEFPPVLDFEDKPVVSANEMLWRAEIWLEIVERETGEIPIVYTSPGYMAQFDKRKSGFLSRYPLWVAHYIQRNYPSIPYPWDNYLMWQYSDRGNYPYYVYPATDSYGKDWGSGSSYLDMNWFNGTYFDLLKYLEEDSPVDPPPITPSPDEYLFKAKCIVDALNVRKGPSITFDKRRIIRKGDIVNVYAVQNNWYKISKELEEWVSGYPQYMQKIGEEGEVLFEAKCVIDSLNIRLGPGTSYSKTGKFLIKGDIVNVYDVKNNWFKISDTEEKWVSGYSQYMQKI